MSEKEVSLLVADKISSRGCALGTTEFVESRTIQRFRCVVKMCSVSVAGYRLNRRPRPWCREPVRLSLHSTDDAFHLFP